MPDKQRRIIEETITRGGHVLRQQRPPYKAWHRLRRDGELDEILLTPGSFLSDGDIKDKYKNRYFPNPEQITKEVKRNTIFCYAPGEYKLYKPTHPLQAEIAGIYLKDVLPVEARDEALRGLEQMDWDKHPPHRPETKPAIERQEGLTRPGELLFGYTNMMTIERTIVSRKHGEQFRHLEPLLREIDACFARTLPAYYSLQNRPKSLAERNAELGKQKQPEYGGISQEFRHFLTAFSTITLLRSCPSAIHKDGGNARADQTSFTCLTSVGSGFKGGTFCLIEYGIKIPVSPGDILIAQTTREWHYNTTPVEGTKYSIVCYYRRGLANPKLKMGKSIRD